MEPLESGHRDPEGDAASCSEYKTKAAAAGDVVHPVLWLVKGRAIASVQLRTARK